MRWVAHPRLRVLYLRRQSAYLGDALDKAKRIYPHFGAAFVTSPQIKWTFPSGAEIWMGHCQHDKHVANYDSFEFHIVLWDELTHFTEKQYRGINARLRRATADAADLPLISRAATNPGGPGHDWVFARWGAWLDPKHSHPAPLGERRWYRGDVPSDASDPLAKSRTFVPALLQDNPHLDRSYEAGLEDLDPVRRAQLRGGNWLVKPAPRMYWDRTRIETLAAMPLQSDVIERIRSWDFAGSIRKNSPFTASVRASKLRSGLIVIEHVDRFRGSPSEVRARFKQIAEADKALDARCVQTIPQDPGQAGKDQVLSYQAENPALQIRSRIPTGDKLTRFGLPSSRAGNGTLQVMHGPWNEAFHSELESIPDNEFWDQADAVSDVVAELTGAAPATLASLSDYRSRLPRPSYE